jgi:hypothetical protein
VLEGNETRDGFDYPSEEYRYFVCAERFGWTPAQTDDSPAVLVDWLIAIGSVVDEVKAEAYKK